MARAIFISGPINAGKTTVSRLLARGLPGTAHVEGDALRHFVGWMSLEESIPITLANLADVSRKSFRSIGCSIVNQTLNPSYLEN